MRNDAEVPVSEKVKIVGALTNLSKGLKMQDKDIDKLKVIIKNTGVAHLPLLLANLPGFQAYMTLATVAHE